MSWDCRDCGEGHPGRFAFCPTSGRSRAVADALADRLNVYHVTRVDQDQVGYCQYRGFVCVAASEEDAGAMLPAPDADEWDWPSVARTVTLVATGAEGPPRVILADNTGA